MQKTKQHQGGDTHREEKGAGATRAGVGISVGALLFDREGTDGGGGELHDQEAGKPQYWVDNKGIEI